MSTGAEAVDQLHKDLAFSAGANRNGVEAIVITNQSTVREVLIEVERLRDRCENPQYYTIPMPKLTAKQRRDSLGKSPVPVIPYHDYGNPRQG